MPGQDVQPQSPAPKPAKPYKGMAMEGLIARWYTSIRRQDPELATAIRLVGEHLPEGGQVLEVAPGPGYLAVELARLGIYRVVGLDISASFVAIAREKAREAGVTVDFQRGNAAAMPFADDSFGFAICRAAFKNFTKPVQAIEEMYRVLKPGGTALIDDLRGDATLEEIRSHICELRLSALNRVFTELAFTQFLLKNAYTADSMRRLVAETSFGACEIDTSAIGMHVWLHK
jgi:ubiquinone/menaquinone biosynthesis C-methylase UbiE